MFIKRYSDVVNRRTVNTTTKLKKTTVEQNNGPQTLHRKVKIKQHESL